MATGTPPSPVIRHLVREFERVLPDSGRVRLAGYADAARATTGHGDLGRALSCADWAVHLAQRRGDSRLERMIEGIGESRVIVRDSLFGAHFGLAVADGVGPAHDVEIQWVDAAVAVAVAEAERVGWDDVPWEDLVRSVLQPAPPDPVAEGGVRRPGGSDVGAPTEGSPS